jgi:hypothetical protein
MKKFVRKAIFFISFFALFSIVINSIFLGIIALTDWDFVKRIESLRFDDPDYELLALGTSLSEYGIDTELLTANGIKSFNLSMVGSSVKTNYVQLNEYLSKYSKRPRYVLLALNSKLEQFDQDGIQPVVEFTMKGHRYNMKDVPISKFRWAGMELLKKAIRSQYRKTYVACGQKKSIRIEPDNSKYNELYLNVQKYESAKWIGEIAKTCSENGIEFIVVEIPGIRETQNLSGSDPYKLIFRNGYSATLYNFNSQEFCKIFDTGKDWSGMSHFNKFGAAKFTQELSSILVK